jgi:hypothetical protein
MIVYRAICYVSRSRRYRAMSESRAVPKCALNSEKGSLRVHIAGYGASSTVPEAAVMCD